MREQVLEAFDPGSIEDNFGDIEFFFSIFPDDAIIKEKSIDLVTAIFQGIEHAISFFITHFGESIRHEASATRKQPLTVSPYDG